MFSMDNMIPKKRQINIPVVEHGSNRVVGGFCSTMDAVSHQELQALAELKKRRVEAEQIKKRLRENQNPDEKPALKRRLQTLRQEAAIWRDKREHATHDKHVALGHVSLPTGYK